jgi:hypothetical protein
MHWPTTTVLLDSSRQLPRLLTSAVSQRTPSDTLPSRLSATAELGLLPQLLTGGLGGCRDGDSGSRGGGSTASIKQGPQESMAWVHVQ